MRSRKPHPFYALASVCIKCAEAAGFTPKRKAAGVWLAKCAVCGETRATMDLIHDYNYNTNKEESK